MNEVLRKYGPTNSANVGTATFGGGGIAVVLIWLFGLYGIKMPPEVAVVFGSLLVGIVGAFGPDGR